jgi:dual specificity protein kinase YAK1
LILITLSQVVKCEHSITKQQVAVKVIKNKQAYFNQAVVELRLLTMLNEE